MLYQDESLALTPQERERIQEHLQAKHKEEDEKAAKAELRSGKPARGGRGGGGSRFTADTQFDRVDFLRFMGPVMW